MRQKQQKWRRYVAVILTVTMMFWNLEGIQAAGMQEVRTAGLTLDAESGRVTAKGTVRITDGIGISEDVPVVFHTYEILYATYDQRTNGLEYHVAQWAADVLGDDADAAIRKLTDPDAAMDGTRTGAGTAAEQNTLVNALAAQDGKTEAADAVWARGGDVYTADLPVGAYLVTANAPGYSFLNMMVSVSAAARQDDPDQWTAEGSESVLKGRPTAIEKKMNGADAISLQIGDTVTCTVRADVPYFPQNASNTVFRVVDTPKNIQIDVGTLQVYGIQGGQKEKLQEQADGSGAYTASLSEEGVLTVDFTENYFSAFYDEEDGCRYDAVELTYQAVLLASAAVGADQNGNSARLEYGDDPYGEGINDTPIEDRTEAYTYGVILTKYGEDQEQPAIRGTEFEITRKDDQEKLFFNGSDGSYVVADADMRGDALDHVTTGEDGTLTVTGLGEGTYIFRETKAPAGYSLSKNTLEVEVCAVQTDAGVPGAELDVSGMSGKEYSGTGEAVEGQGAWNGPAAGADRAYFSVSLTDTRLPQLPETGGIGTAVFTTAGAALMLIAIILVFFAQKKKPEKGQDAGK